MLALLVLLAAAALAILTPAGADAATDLLTNDCTSASAATDIPSPFGGVPGVTGTDCTVEFGSSDSTASLLVSQADGYGDPAPGEPDGTLDPNFNAGAALPLAWDGYVSTSNPTNGDIVTVGETCGACVWTVEEDTPSGAKDSAFNNDSTGDYGGNSPGMATLRLFGDTDNTALAVAVQPDGKILVSGYTDTGDGARLAIARLLPDGDLDPGFGEDGSGISFIADNAMRMPSAIALQPDGKILISGFDNMTDVPASVVRLLPDGQIDRSFGTDGYWQDANADTYAMSVLVQPDGKLLVGITAGTDPPFSASVERLTANGTPDATFGTGGNFPLGWSMYPLDTDYEPQFTRTGLALEPNGEILVANQTKVGANYDLAVGKLTANGAFDTSFGTGGTATAQVGTCDATTHQCSDAGGVFVDPNGSIVTGGVVANGTSWCGSLVRFTANGVLDTTLNGTGYVVPAATCDTNVDNVVGTNVVPTLDGGYAETVHIDDDDGSELVKYADTSIPNYGGANTWASGNSLFGICLNSVGGPGAAAVWAASGANCPATDAGGYWHGVPASETGSSVVAQSTTSGEPLASASFRFGAAVSATQTMGSYAAPIEFDVVAPDLTAPSNTVAPSIVGTADTRHALTANVGTWTGSSPITYSYQWQRCPGTCTNISGATSQRYAPVSADIGDKIDVVVTATNSVGSASATSAKTSTVTTASITGAVLVDGFEAGVPCDGCAFGTPTYETSIVHNGTWALEAPATGDNGSYPPVPTSTVAVARDYMYVDNVPTHELETGGLGNATSPYPECDVAISASGKWEGIIADDTTKLATVVSAVTVAPRSWHRFDYRCDFSTNTWKLDWQIDGAAQTPVTYPAGATNTINHAYFGDDPISTSSPNTHIYVDDAIVSTTSADYPIGDGQTLALTDTAPASQSGAGGTDGDFKLEGSGTTVTAGNESGVPGYVSDTPFAVSASGPTGSIEQNTNSASAYLETDVATPTNAATANGVEAWAGLHGSSNNSTTATVKIDYTQGSSGTLATTLSPSANLATGTLTVLSGIVTPPGGGWTTANVSTLAAHMGFNSGTAKPYFDNVQFQADFPAGSTPVNTSPPVVSGNARSGATLSATTGSWNFSPSSYAYQWQDCNAAATVCTPIGGATGSTYTAQAADAGDTLAVVVTATNANGSQTQMSAVTSTVATAASDIVYATGFESGTLGVGGSGGIASALGGAGLESITTNHVHDGNYALHLAPTASQPALFEHQPGSPLTIGVTRVSFMLESLPTATYNLVSFQTSGTPSAGAIIQVAPTGQLDIEASASSGVTVNASVPPIVPWQWYTVDLRLDSSGTTWTGSWQVDGAAQPPVTQPGLTALTITAVRLGSGTPNTTAVDYDDWAISGASSDYPLGFGKVLGLRPIGIGAITNPGHYQECQTNTTDCANMAAADANEQPGESYIVDHWPISQTPPADEYFMYEKTYGATDSLGVLMEQSHETGAPDAVGVLGAQRAKTTGAGANAVVNLVNGANTTQLYDQEPQFGFTSVDYMYGVADTAPGGAAWTTALLNSSTLSFSESSGTSPLVITDGLFEEADYPTGPAPTNTATPVVGWTGDTVPRVGAVLTTTTGTWTDSPSDYRYQWQRCDSTGANCVDIAGANGESYTAASADATNTLRVVVTAIDDNGGQTAVSGVTPTVPNAVPSYTFVDGFEEGMVSASGSGLAAAVNGATVTSASARTGGYGLHSTCGGGVQHNLYFNEGTSVEDVSFELRVNAVGAVSLGLAPVDLANGDALEFALNTSGQAYTFINDGSTRSLQTGPNIADGKWHLIDLRFDTSSTTYTIDWRVDGVQQTQSAYTEAASSTISMQALGEENITTGCNLDFDDLSISHTASDYPLPKAKIVGIGPASTGTGNIVADFQDDGGTAIGALSWLALTDPPFGNGSAYLRQVTGSTSAYVDVGLGTLSDVTPNAYAVQGIAGYAASASGSTASGKIKLVRPGDTDAAAPTVFSGNFDTSGTTTRFATAIVAAPSAGWTDAQLDALHMRFGYTGTVTHVPRWTGGMVEVVLPD